MLLGFAAVVMMWVAATVVIFSVNVIRSSASLLLSLIRLVPKASTLDFFSLKQESYIRIQLGSSVDGQMGPRPVRSWISSFKQIELILQRIIQLVSKASRPAFGRRLFHNPCTLINRGGYLSLFLFIRQ